MGSFPPFEMIDTALAKRSFWTTAVINLKKASRGVGTSDPAVINAYAWLDRELLRKQVSFIAPKIIVACGTSAPLIWLLNLPVDPDHLNRAVKLPDGVRVIPFRHPSYDKRKAETYNRLKALFDESGRGQAAA